MPKALIYDVAGSHYENVKASYLYTASEGAVVERIDPTTESALLAYCLEHDFKILIVPYLGRQRFFASLMMNGITVFVAGKAYHLSEGTSREFGAPISVGGGDAETKNTGGGAEIYTEALNFTGTQRHATSYTCAALAGMVEASGLIDNYTPFEIKQIIRQNGDNYPNHSTTQGFGKVTSIVEPESIDETLDVMNIQKYFTQGRKNLLFFRVVEPQYYEGELKLYVDGVLTEPDAILRDEYSTWVFLKGFGSTNQNQFTVTYFEPEIYNTDYIGANIGSYSINELHPVFNSVFLYGNRVQYQGEVEGLDYLGYASNTSYFDAGKLTIYSGEEIISEEIRSASSSFSLAGLQGTYTLKFEVYTNGELYPEAEYELNTETGEITLIGELYNPNSTEPEPEPESEPEPEPAPTTPTITREGTNILVTPNEEGTVLLYRKPRINNDWELIGETLTDTVNENKNYIYSIAYTNGETETAKSEPVYVAGEVKGAIGVL